MRTHIPIISGNGPKARLMEIARLQEVKARQFHRELFNHQVMMRPVKVPRGKMRMAEVGVISRGCRSPAVQLGQAISEALDPARAPGKVRTLFDMTAEEKAAMEAQYDAKICPSDRSLDLVLLPERWHTVGETEKALQLSSGSRTVWIPKSEVEVLPDGRFKTFRWLARHKKMLGFPQLKKGRVL